MDPTQQRQVVRDALSGLGIGAAAVSSFDDDALDKLFVGKFHSLERLQWATREGLKDAGLAPGDVCLIMSKVQGGGAGGAAAATGSAGLQSTSEVGGLEEVVSPSSLYNITFTLFNGSHLATTLVSHAKALGFRGRVRHLSGSRSDFTLLLSAAENGGWQKLVGFVKWVGDQVPLHKSAVEAEAAGSSAAEVKAACAVVTSNLAKPCTSDRALLDLYKCGQLSVQSSPTVQLALEQAVRVAEQEERLSQFSPGKSSATSAQE